MSFSLVKSFCENTTKGFTFTSIDRNIPYDPNLRVSSDFKNHEQILSQPFFFLDRGGQFYVLVSQDKTTVIKFFKKQYNIPDSFIQAIDRFLPASLKKYRFQFLKTRQERFYPIFESCQIAENYLKEETGILYLHLNPTETLSPLKIIDNLGISHTLNLNTTSFVVQRYAERIFSRMEKQLTQHDIKGAKQLIHNIFEYIQKRSQKGVRDNDNGLKRNYGYIGNKAISLDIGSFTLDDTLQDPLVCQAELERKTKQLGKWIEEFYPELLPCFKEELKPCSKL
jgi:hypothetical protein